jgi:hypothetical protein
MKKYFAGCVVAALIISCQNNDPATNNNDNSDTGKTVVVTPNDSTEKGVAEADGNDRLNNKNCYAGFQNKDMVVLSFTQMDSLITGDLAYNYYEKDKNKGKIKGVMRGDTIIAEYNFESEGVLSVREVVFLRKGNTIVEGFGDVVDDRGKMVFKDRTSLSFDNSLVMKKADCERQEQSQNR